MIILFNYNEAINFALFAVSSSIVAMPRVMSDCSVLPISHQVKHIAIPNYFKPL